jgi:hypothetical protein
LEVHKEWFEIPCEEGIAVVEKWTRWMETSPYEKSEAESNKTMEIAGWKLKKEAHEGLSALLG